jgi:hypothetical protein
LSEPVTSTPSTRGQRLRVARAKRFASAREAAIALGIPVSTYSAHERAESPGGREYTPEVAQRYARRFGVTAEWLLTGYVPTAGGKAGASRQPKPAAPTKFRIRGYIGRGGRVYFYQVAPEDLEEIELPNLVTESTVAFEIRGKSMGSFFNHWFLLFDDLRRRPTPDLVDELCMVALADGRMLIKLLGQGRAEGQFDLISQGEPPMRNAAIVWAAKVKGLVQVLPTVRK